MSIGDLEVRDYIIELNSLEMTAKSISHFRGELSAKNKRVATFRLLE